MKILQKVGVIFIIGIILIGLFVIDIPEENIQAQVVSEEPIIIEVEKEVIVEKEVPIEKEVIVEKEIVVEKEVIVEKKVLEGYIALDVPDVDTSFKAYMDYRAITNKDSIQYKMQQEAYTDELGFRKYNGCYMVALGSFYSTKCGEYFLIEFEGGATIKAVTGDLKSDKHTNSTHQYSSSNNVVEFIVDTNKLNSHTKNRGDISYSGLLGKVVGIYKQQ